MTNPLPAFLAAVVRKGMMGRRWGRQLYLELMSYAGMDLGMDGREQYLMTDLQATALAWFLNQRFLALLASNLGTPAVYYQQQVASQEGQPRSVTLPDGSRLDLNANTRVRVEFDAERRIVHLDQGQVFLDVAPNKERPLFVDAGTARVRVVGTAFDLRRGQQELVLSVDHGLVAFEAPGERREPMLLGARERAVYNLARGDLSRQTLGDGEVADWRSGHVSFRNRELASLVDELSLYRPAAVLLADPTLAKYRVSGNLDVNDPDALLNALPALLPVKTAVLADGRMRIERK